MMSFHPLRLSPFLALTIALPLFLASGALAQPRPLSLDEALRLATQQSFAVRQAEAARDAARGVLHQHRAAFLPSLSVTETAVTTTDPLNAFGFKLRQETVSQADFAPERLNDPERTDLFTTRFEVRQPLLNLDALMNHRAAARQEQAASHETTRARHQIAFEVKKQYFALVLARRRLAVLDTALVAARRNREQAGRFFDEGLITRAEKLEADVRVLELEQQRTAAEHALRDASDRLRYLLNLPEDVALQPTDDLTFRPVALDALDAALVNRQRSDMQALRLRVEAARATLQAGKLQFLPRLNVFGSYDLNAPSFGGTQGRGWTVGASLQWKLFDGYRQLGGLEQAAATLRQARLALEERALNNEVEIAAARRGIVQAQHRLDLARTAIEQARENLRIRSDRYAQGLEKTTDVLQAETLLARQRLVYLTTLYEYYVSIFRLEYLLERPLLDL